MFVVGSRKGQVKLIVVVVDSAVEFISEHKFISEHIFRCFEQKSGVELQLASKLFDTESARSQ